MNRSRWSGRELDIILHRPNHVLLTLALGADRRAIHLEAALAGRRHAVWYPKGLTNASLREIYRGLVADLLQQFLLSCEGTHEQLPHPGFNRALNANRFAINVFVEAILSVWTDTPLPDSALALRTQVLVRAIGWGRERPADGRANHVLFRGPRQRVTSLADYAKHLRASDYARIAAAEADKHWGYLTLPEARLIGLRCRDSVGHLATLTRQGQFLAFDGRRGVITENKNLPDRARLSPEYRSKEMILPAWAYQSQKQTPACSIGEAARYLFSEPPADVALRLKAQARRSRREERKSLRFSPLHDPGATALEASEADSGI